VSHLGWTAFLLPACGTGIALLLIRAPFQRLVATGWQGAVDRNGVRLRPAAVFGVLAFSTALGTVLGLVVWMNAQVLGGASIVVDFVATGFGIAGLLAAIGTGLLFRAHIARFPESSSRYFGAVLGSGLQMVPLLFGLSSAMWILLRVAKGASDPSTVIPLAFLGGTIAYHGSWAILMAIWGAGAQGSGRQLKLDMVRRQAPWLLPSALQFAIVYSFLTMF